MRKVLITGANGFVGGALLREVLLRGWEVRALVRPGSEQRAISDLEGRFERCPGDLRDPSSLRSAVRGCDLVFHVAARYSLWNPDPREIQADNVDGTRNLFEAAAEEGVGRVIHTSTVGVLKVPADGRPADESCLAALEQIRGHYKRSKWQAEEVALSFARKGLSVVVVNPSAPVGPGDAKPTPTGRMLLDFLNGLVHASTDTGLNLVSVEDVALGHILAAEKGVPGERYILGGEDLYLRQIYGLLSEITGIPAPTLSVPRWILPPLSVACEIISRWTRKPPMLSREAAVMARQHMFFDSGKARRELGYLPGPVKPALERAVRWFVENGYVRRAVALRGPPDRSTRRAFVK